jgi:hypothetical protein
MLFVWGQATTPPPSNKPNGSLQLLHLIQHQMGPHVSSLTNHLEMFLVLGVD